VAQAAWSLVRIEEEEEEEKSMMIRMRSSPFDPTRLGYEGIEWTHIFGTRQAYVQC